MAYIVLIEWDGNHPPRKFYRRLHRRAMRVRGDMDLGPIKRRAVGAKEDKPKALIFQEGAIISESRSAATQIYILARDMIDELYKEGEVQGSPAVHMARMEWGKTMTRDPRDQRMAAKLEAKFSKPGRPPNPEAYVVTCQECGTVSAVETHDPVGCPSCMGFEIMSRKGDLKAYADPGGSVLKAWIRTRFSGSHFEPKDLTGTEDPPEKPRIGSQKDQEIVDLMAASSNLWPLLDTMDRDMALDYLDAIYLGRRYDRQETRDRRRAEITVQYLMRVNDPVNAPLVEGDPDLVDASGIIAEDSIVQWLVKLAPDELKGE